MTLLMTACRDGQLGVVKILVDLANEEQIELDLDCCSSERMNAFDYAVLRGEREIAEYLENTIIKANRKYDFFDKLSSVSF